MSTGDIRNNLRKLHSQLKLVNYKDDLDIEGLVNGKATAFLPILHYVFADYSIELAQYLFNKDYEFLGKSDLKFIHVVYLILRDEFNVKASITKDQFFTLGFAERKIQLVTSIVQACRYKNEQLNPRKRKIFHSKRISKSSENLHHNYESLIPVNKNNVIFSQKPVDTSQITESIPRAISPNTALKDHTGDGIPRRGILQPTLVRGGWENDDFINRMSSLTMKENVAPICNVVREKLTCDKEVMTFEPEEKAGYSDNPVKEKTMLLNLVREQQCHITKLQQVVDENSKVCEQLMKQNNELSARVMILETSTTLLQEKLKLYPIK